MLKRLVPAVVLLCMFCLVALVRAAEYVNVSGHLLWYCTSTTEYCTFRFFEQNVTISVCVYDLTLQTDYGCGTMSNAFGFNVSDTWFNDKILMLNGTILFYAPLAEKLGVYTIELTDIRKTISVNIYISQSLLPQWKIPMFLVSYESINNTPVWGQLDIIQAVTYYGQIQDVHDIPYYWYDTYGCFALYSLPTGNIKTWCGVKFTDYVYLSIQSDTGTVTGQVVIESPSGEKVILPPPPVYQAQITPVTAILHDLSKSSYLGILGLALIIAVVVWSYKTEKDTFTGATLASGIVMALGAILQNISLVAVGAFVFGVFLFYRIVRGRTAYY